MFMAVIREVWGGYRSLGETFWLWGVLVGSIMVGFGGGLATMAAIQEFNSLWPIFVLLAITLPLNVWLMVGLWRCATNHPSGWAIVVKVLCAIGAPFWVYRCLQLFALASS